MSLEPFVDLEDVFRLFEKVLHRVARCHLSPMMRRQLDSVDVVQSIWARVMQRMEKESWQFNHWRELRAFLIKMVRNRVIDLARKIQASNGREYAMTEEHARHHPGEESPSQIAQAQELWEKLLFLCPPQHRVILQMKRQGHTISEIAAEIGLHPGSIRRILHQLARHSVLQSIQGDTKVNGNGL